MYNMYYDSKEGQSKGYEPGTILQVTVPSVIQIDKEIDRHYAIQDNMQKYVTLDVSTQVKYTNRQCAR